MTLCFDHLRGAFPFFLMMVSLVFAFEKLVYLQWLDVDFAGGGTDACLCCVSCRALGTRASSGSHNGVSSTSGASSVCRHSGDKVRVAKVIMFL